MRGGFLMNSVHCPACWPTYLRLNDSAMPPPPKYFYKGYLAFFLFKSGLSFYCIFTGCTKLGFKKELRPICDHLTFIANSPNP